PKNPACSGACGRPTPSATTRSARAPPTARRGSERWEGALPNPAFGARWRAERGRAATAMAATPRPPRSRDGPTASRGTCRSEARSEGRSWLLEGDGRDPALSREQLLALRDRTWQRRREILTTRQPEAIGPCDSHVDHVEVTRRTQPQVPVEQ